MNATQFIGMFAAAFALGYLARLLGTSPAAEPVEPSDVEQPRLGPAAQLLRALGWIAALAGTALVLLALAGAEWFSDKFSASRVDELLAAGQLIAGSGFVLAGAAALAARPAAWGRAKRVALGSVLVVVFVAASIVVWNQAREWSTLVLALGAFVYVALAQLVRTGRAPLVDAPTTAVDEAQVTIAGRSVVFVLTSGTNVGKVFSATWGDTAADAPDVASDLPPLATIRTRLLSSAEALAADRGVNNGASVTPAETLHDVVV